MNESEKLDRSVLVQNLIWVPPVYTISQIRIRIRAEGNDVATTPWYLGIPRMKLELTIKCFEETKAALKNGFYTRFDVEEGPAA